jgi:hypothetical protein
MDQFSTSSGCPIHVFSGISGGPESSLLIFAAEFGKFLLHIGAGLPESIESLFAFGVMGISGGQHAVPGS